MKNIYLIIGKNLGKHSSSAYAPSQTPPSHKIDISKFKNGNVDFELRLVSQSIGKNGLGISDDLSKINVLWSDYLPNSLAWPLMSEKLKLIIDENTVDNDKIEWLKIKIIGNKEKKDYYILKFKEFNDVLDVKNTIYAEKSLDVLEPSFSKQKVQDLNILTIPSNFEYNKITTLLFVGDKIKKAIKNKEITGIAFEKYRIF